MLDDNVAQTLAIIIPILAGLLVVHCVLTKRINTFADRLCKRIDRLGDRICESEGRIHADFNAEFVGIRRDLARVREDLAEIKGKVDLMAAIVTKSENERMAEAIIALETRRTSTPSE